MQTITKLLPIDTKRRSGLKNLGIKFIVCHSTGNINSSAQQNVDYYIKTADEVEASANAFVDDISVIICIPFDEKSWHVRRIAPADNNIFGLDSNDYALGIELCFFDDVERSKKAYNNYIALIRSLISVYNLDPIKCTPGHFELDPGRKTDPMDAFKIIGKTWQDFKKDVSEVIQAPVIEKDEIKKEAHRLIDLL